MPASIHLLAVDTTTPELKLPSYTRRPTAGCSTVLVNRETKTFEYKLAKSAAGPGISLNISGDSKLSKELPSFTEGDKVVGTVQVSVNNGHDIRAVHLSLKGRVLTGRTSDGVCTFLDLRDTLWTAELGDLEAHKDVAGEYDYTWPFSLILPEEVSLPTSVEGESGQTFPLPHSFMESGIPARVCYELTVCLKLGKWKRNRKIATEIGYFQSNRRFARNRDLLATVTEPYDTEAPLDLTYWKTLRTLLISGSVQQSPQRNVELSCTLSLKNSSKSCYTRGSSIPLLLVLRSQDQQALKLLASPDAITVRLTRRIRYKDVQMCGDKSSRWSSVTEDVGAATWRLHEADRATMSNDYSSTLVGKIKLSHELVPSAVIANLAIQYFVSLYPFSLPAFQPKDSKSVPLLSQTVLINTDLSVCRSM
ncbi:hypothetical protein BDP27DRAFT_1326193 [Rhodocollybia butyracea]|uniref:Arrestin-like N-terminal domain-containing protein n=1 Tax=Rhodocollybia butyracea TaxID=206335 RepID=A0A9P5PVW9_9AGAR|nr:hypothetical protein BDP27DRAFT_1326193 [Rhodocollybia butyracea]